MTLSDEELSKAAEVSVTAWIQEMSEAGFKTVADVNQREGGRALERSLVVFLNASAKDRYAKQAEILFQAGIRDEELDAVLTQSIDRVTIQILKRLLGLGFQVENLLDQYESGMSILQVDFSIDDH